MPSTNTYYLDGPSLDLSTAVYSTSALDTAAPDGLYSDGNVTVRQNGGVIVTIYNCGECVCKNITLASSGHVGFYNADLIAGTGVGAIILEITVPDNVAPVGFRVIEDFLGSGDVYHNKIVSKTAGLTPDVATTFSYPSNSGRFVHVGHHAQVGTCDASFGASDFTNHYSIFDWDGSAFVDTGVDGSQTVYDEDVFLHSYAAGNPETYFMVIPKTVLTRSAITVQALASCTSNNWSIRVDCPVALTGFQISDVDAENCDALMTGNGYNAPVNGSSGVPGLYDFVFSDANGETPLADGQYKITTEEPASYLMTVTNGIVTAISSCL